MRGGEGAQKKKQGADANAPSEVLEREAVSSVLLAPVFYSAF
jgi:hypothetical protein